MIVLLIVILCILGLIGLASVLSIGEDLILDDVDFLQFKLAYIVITYVLTFAMAIVAAVWFTNHYEFKEITPTPQSVEK